MVGQRIGAVAGHDMKRLLLELGGKGAARRVRRRRPADGDRRPSSASGRSTRARSAPRRRGCMAQRGVYDQFVARARKPRPGR